MMECVVLYMYTLTVSVTSFTIACLIALHLKFTFMVIKDKWVIMHILQMSYKGKLHQLISYKLYSLRQYGPSA